MSLSKVLVSAWYSRQKWLCLLRPLSWLYALVVKTRSLWLKFVLTPYKSRLLVVVVGNISLGGTGKTPVVIALSEYLVRQGEQVGVVLRGYKGAPTDFPHQVTADDKAELVGDEAALLYHRLTHLGVPVIVDPQRARAVQYLESLGSISVVLCDDGLQHYRLARDIEIAVLDGQRRMGNQWLLPAGPLREPVSRLKSVDWVITKGQAQGNEVSMSLSPIEFRSIDGKKYFPIDFLAGETAHALAGIGHPQLFFETLTKLGLIVIEHPFADHASIQAADLIFNDSYPVIMTSKDRVKCLNFKLDNHYYLEVGAQLEDHFYTGFMSRVKYLKQRKQKENHG